MNRRRFMAGLAAAIVGGIGAARYELGSTPPVGTAGAAGPAGPVLAAAVSPPATPARALLPPPPPSARVALPGNGLLTVLPGDSDLLALTVDDGVSTDVVRLYTQFAKDTGVRMTYFVNGTYRSWTDNATLLRPLVESGQIQLGNHTFSHPDLTTVSHSRMADEITRNDRFLKSTYGVDGRPYLRPPYGRHNASVRACAADLGYTLTLWSGSLSDSTVVTEDFIVKMANQYFRPQRIVLGHLNHAPVTHVYDRLVDLIRDRKLRTVTLNDVFR
ncbi:MAG: polysaccharide deacetylase family protein [Mycobacteriaceae bacterium]|nr:polysaccharide deacetylase family protein [Mycobacteriaceae bacterium]